MTALYGASRVWRTFAKLRLTRGSFGDEAGRKPANYEWELRGTLQDLLTAERSCGPSEKAVSGAVS